jgi:hypothetical protein
MGESRRQRQKKKRAPKLNPQHEALYDAYCKAMMRVYGARRARRPAASVENDTCADEVLSRITLEEAPQLLEIYIQLREEFLVKVGHAFRYFASRLDRCLALRVEKAEDDHSYAAVGIPEDHDDPERQQESDEVLRAWETRQGWK